MKSKTGTVPIAYRLAVTSRVLAAVFGGYVLAALSSVLITLSAALPRVDAVVAGMMVSFVVYLLAVIWCFACRTAIRAWLGILLPALLLAAIDGLLYWMKQP